MEHINLPNDVKVILNKLNSEGFEAYAVGGCVRDSIMNISPDDWDICTSALPSETKVIFKNYKVIETGVKHGTVTVMINNTPYEITTYRKDGEYKNNRHPNNVEFVSNIKEDLMRRDFTINSLAYHPEKGIVDLFGGLEDIKNGIIRCVGNSNERFNEDALRMLRAIRFAIKYDFDIEEKTLRALDLNKHLLNNISIERINSELSKILSYKYLNKRFYLGIMIVLLDEVFPELRNLHTYGIENRLFNSFSGSDFIVRLAILFDSPEIKGMLKKLRFSNDVINSATTVRNCGKLILQNREYWCGKNSLQHRRYFSRKLLCEIGYDNSLRACDFVTSLLRASDVKLYKHIGLLKADIIIGFCCDVYKLSQLAVNGNDLIDLGYKGKQIGKGLTLLLEKVMRDEIKNEKTELIKALKQHKGG